MGFFPLISIRLCLLWSALYPPKNFLSLSLISDIISDNKTALYYSKHQNIRKLLLDSTGRRWLDAWPTHLEQGHTCISYSNHSRRFSHPKNFTFSWVKIFLYTFCINIGHEIISHAFIHRRSLTWFYHSTFAGHLCYVAKRIITYKR